MKVEIHLHNAKPTVWSGANTIGIWFNDKNVEVTAFMDSPDAAIEAGRKLIEFGKKAKEIEEIRNRPVTIEE